RAVLTADALCNSDMMDDDGRFLRAFVDGSAVGAARRENRAPDPEFCSPTPVRRSWILYHEGHE
ncbi:MAG: hypothetical protein ACK58T_21080, partial [Phycisphaerae bacterium]